MTREEAIERAGLIWGTGAIQSVEMTDTGGAYVDVEPEQARRKVNETHKRGSAFENHHIDTNGHPTCHVACKQAEEKL